MWLPSDKTVMDMDCYVHYILYDLITSRQMERDTKGFHTKRELYKK
jgi:hypothetical protein